MQLVNRGSCVALVALFAARAFGQSHIAGAAGMTQPLKDRGTYHLATGTWSAPGVSTPPGGVLYNNSSPSGYFFPTRSTRNPADQGRIPSRHTGAGISGTSDLYRIDGFRIAYCSSDDLPVVQSTVFFERYEPCADTGGLGVGPTVASFVASGLPTGSPTGGQNCWMVAFDLSNTTLAFEMLGDAEGSFDADPEDNTFGWLSSYPTAIEGPMGNGVGPVIAGNCRGGGGLASPPQGFGTQFAGTPGATDSTGLGQSDFFWLDVNDNDPPQANSGCYFFGGCTNFGTFNNPYAGFWLQLFGTEVQPQIGTRYCSSLVNATGSQASLVVDGTDANFDLVFTSSPVPETGGFMINGPMRFQHGGTNLGDGLRCVGGMTARLPTVVAGMMMQPPNTAVFALNYSAPYASTLTGRRFFQHWFRSSLSTGTGSNTSDAFQIDF